MFPTLDHRKVYWWGERSALSIIDLDTLKAVEYPMAVGTSGAKLVTYSVLVINQKVIYIMNEDDEYKMVYYYDLLQNSLIGTWDYSNDECKPRTPNLTSRGPRNHPPCHRRQREGQHHRFRRLRLPLREHEHQPVHLHPQDQR